MALEEKKMGLLRSHPELPPHQNKRRSGNQRHQPFLPTSGCVIPRREKCQKWSENQQGHNCTWLLHLRERHGRGEGAAMPPSLRGCLLSAVLRLPVAPTPQSSFQAASHPKSHLKGMKLDQDTVLSGWRENGINPRLHPCFKRRAELLLGNKLPREEEDGAYPVAAVLPLGSSEPVPSCSQNQWGLCCPQLGTGAAGTEHPAPTLSASHTSSLLRLRGCVKPTELTREG